MIPTRAHPIMYVAALVGVLLSGCTSRPAEISLARLVQEQEAFFGDEVKTRGTVRKFEDVSGSYYVLEDQGRNRIALVPASKVKGLLAEEVTVTGKFEFKPTFGRVIEVRRIVPDSGRAHAVALSGAADLLDLLLTHS